MDYRLECTPWLAGLFVIPEFRSRDVGGALITRIFKKVLISGIARLFLFTQDKEQYYKTSGWDFFEKIGYRNEELKTGCRFSVNGLCLLVTKIIL
jgi:N-acetylglutamate synthase-like GNAT family acetyltransferase